MSFSVPRFHLDIASMDFSRLLRCSALLFDIRMQRMHAMFCAYSINLLSALLIAVKIFPQLTAHSLFVALFL